jgi:hypothetical protein
MIFAATAAVRAPECRLNASEPVLELVPLDPQAADNGGDTQAHEQHEERKDQAKSAGDDDVGLAIGRRVDPRQLEQVVRSGRQVRSRG